MNKYEAPALHILAVETVNVLLASGGHIIDGGTGKEEDGGDVVFQSANPTIDIFR